MTWTRRDILKLASASLMFSSGCEQRVSRRPATRPRYFVTIFLRGGIDAILTTNPKTRADVAAEVDVPYRAADILEVGGTPLGPHLAPIAGKIGQIAIVNGVQVQTANHETGTVQMVRVKTRCTPQSPGLLDIIASHRDGQPLGTMSLGHVSAIDHSPGWFGSSASTSPDRKTLLDRLDDASPADLELMAHGLRSQLEGLTARHANDATIDNLSQTALLFERLRDVPPFRPAVWSSHRKAQALAADFQRMLWALQHDLVGCVYLKVFYDWDSHFNNHNRQVESSGMFMPMFDRFLSEMNIVSNRFGTLASNTAIFCGSELGRFPILNADRGKDHFPEAPYLFLGPGINTYDGKGAVFGTTGKQMQTLPVSLETGHDAGPERHIITLDDIGATLLSLAGIEPERHGYDGRRLNFLLTV